MKKPLNAQDTKKTGKSGVTFPIFFWCCALPPPPGTLSPLFALGRAFVKNGIRSQAVPPQPETQKTDFQKKFENLDLLLKKDSNFVKKPKKTKVLQLKCEKVKNLLFSL